MLVGKKSEDLTRTLVITGGSSGIGKEFIRQYSNTNNNVTICNLSRSKPDLLSDFDNAFHFAVDFTDAGQFAQVREELVAFLREHHRQGEIMLVNNSGFGSFGFFDENDGKRGVEMIDVNVKAPLLLTADLFPMLKKFGGTVVNIASTAAYQPTPHFINYGATKAFLAHWSLGLWRENLNTGIKVVTVCPGPTSTAFFDHAGIREKPDGGRGMTVDVVVRKILKATLQGRPLVICGMLNRIIAAFSILPKTWITHLAYTAIRKTKLESR